MDFPTAQTGPARCFFLLKGEKTKQTSRRAELNLKQRLKIKAGNLLPYHRFAPFFTFIVVLRAFAASFLRGVRTTAESALCRPAAAAAAECKVGQLKDRTKHIQRLDNFSVKNG